ncbi:hypothetical protein [Streptomyces sp. OE57]|uniref:hypothetical protein n=1 Tax=Streptomyces lacaronensis TaxID=3379885 RepID=UPI0039B74049
MLVRGFCQCWGCLNGRDVRVNDLEKSLATLDTLLGLAHRVDVVVSCSLLHVPLDTTAERDIEPRILPGSHADAPGLHADPMRP